MQRKVLIEEIDKKYQIIQNEFNLIDQEMEQVNPCLSQIVKMVNTLYLSLDGFYSVFLKKANPLQNTKNNLNAMTLSLSDFCILFSNTRLQINVDYRLKIAELQEAKVDQASLPQDTILTELKKIRAEITEIKRSMHEGKVIYPGPKMY